MAVRHLERAASKQGTALIKSHLAMAYFKAGNQQKSRETLAAVLRIVPNSPEAKMASELVNVQSRAIPK
jgi:Tfp pilus assembly protein PilF